MSEGGKQEAPKEGRGVGEEREGGKGEVVTVRDVEEGKEAVGERGETPESLPGGGEQETQCNVSGKEGDKWRGLLQHVVGVGQLLSYSGNFLW